MGFYYDNNTGGVVPRYTTSSGYYNGGSYNSYTDPNTPTSPRLTFAGGLFGGTDANTPPRATTLGGDPTTGGPVTAPKPQMPDLSHLDFSNDPILLRVQALVKQRGAQSEADALAQRRQLAIGYGDPELAKQLGLGKDVIGQAGGNTFGTLQELQRGYGRRNVFDINSPLSDHANLFYSSERGRQLALSGEQYLRDQYNAQSAIQQRLADISNAVVQAKLSAQNDQIQAEQEAYQRAIQNALAAAGVS